MGHKRRTVLVCLILLLTSGCRTPEGGPSLEKETRPSSGDDDGPFDPETANQIEALFKQVVDSRSPPGATHVKRAVFLKPHGCMRAKFEVPEASDPILRQGIFATPGSHD